MELIIIGLGYPIVLFLNLRNEKIELSKIYVSFLLIPTPVSRMIKAFAGKIEQVLEIDKNFWSKIGKLDSKKKKTKI